MLSMIASAWAFLHFNGWLQSRSSFPFFNAKGSLGHLSEVEPVRKQQQQEEEEEEEV